MGSLLEMGRLFVKLKGKLIELTGEYEIFDEAGTQVGSIREEGQSRKNKLARLTNLGALGTRRFCAYDVGGSKVLEVIKPGGLKPRFEVNDGTGTGVVTMVMGKRLNPMKPIRFSLTDPHGEALGEMVSTKGGLRTSEFKILDGKAVEVGGITKQWGGAARELFTTSDTYLVEIDAGTTGPLRLVALAGAVPVDLVQVKASMLA